MCDLPGPWGVPNIRVVGDTILVHGHVDIQEGSVCQVPNTVVGSLKYDFTLFAVMDIPLLTRPRCTKVAPHRVVDLGIHTQAAAVANQFMIVFWMNSSNDLSCCRTCPFLSKYVQMTTHASSRGEQYQRRQEEAEAY